MIQEMSGNQSYSEAISDCNPQKKYTWFYPINQTIRDTSEIFSRKSDNSLPILNDFEQKF